MFALVAEEYDENLYSLPGEPLPGPTSLGPPPYTPSGPPPYSNSENLNSKRELKEEHEYENEGIKDSKGERRANANFYLLQINLLQ